MNPLTLGLVKIDHLRQTDNSGFQWDRECSQPKHRSMMCNSGKGPGQRCSIQFRFQFHHPWKSLKSDSNSNSNSGIGIAHHWHRSYSMAYLVSSIRCAGHTSFNAKIWWIWPNLECNLKTRDSQKWPHKRNVEGVDLKRNNQSTTHIDPQVGTRLMLRMYWGFC